ncbi:MAG: dihydroorotate dehydrogenase [Eubacteriales bacterium]|nr:dihydroorotate dehydrogenase [Eubacteriales bacterium]
MVDLSVNLCGLPMDNPVIPASGTFGFGHELASFLDLTRLGSISCKGTTREPRFGNPTPRIAEAPAGMLNAVGLQNPGIDVVLREELPALAKVYPKPVIANICGFSIEEYTEVAAAFDKAPEVGWLELNISCPNVHGGGASFGTDPGLAAEVTASVRAAVKKPLLVKLTPTAGDITAVARACEQAGADGLSLINTLPGMRIDLRSRRPVLANLTGGLSGPALFPIALRMVYQVYEAVKIPIVGLGGISTAEDVIEMMLAGAAAVQVGAAGLRDPKAWTRIIDDLPIVMEKYGIEKLSYITGGAHQ